MSDDDSRSKADAGSTIWVRSIAGQLSGFLRTESGSSGVLLGAVVAALVWANISPDSYDWLWRLPLQVQLGPSTLSLDLRGWVSSGLMTLFFLVVGLEARREFDLGSLRERRQFVIPMFAGLTGMAVPVAIFIIVNAGGPGARGWGVAMSTDTALALGLMTLVGRNLPQRIRAFVLTVFIVDDLLALVVIAIAYTTHLDIGPLLVAVSAFAVLLGSRRFPTLRPLNIPLALVSWVGLLISGVDPIVLGLAIGLATPAYAPDRRDLEQVSGLFRRFREQPTSEFARSAAIGLRASLSPNERLQAMYHRWTSYFIIPVFAVANAGIHLNARFLGTAWFAPITIGVVVGYVVGKPVAVFGVSALVTRLTRGSLRPPVGWVAVAGSGTIAGVGFTVAVLVAGLAFTGEQLAQAKFAILVAAALSSLVTWAVFRIVNLLSAPTRARALLGANVAIADLVEPVDEYRDHIRGRSDAPVTVVEYGDFQCPYCGRAQPSVLELLTDKDVRFVWRHLPISDVHPDAQMAAEAAEAADEQGAFWPMHDLLLRNQDRLSLPDLEAYAVRLGLDLTGFQDALSQRRFRSRVEDDVRSADLSGASGTPTFFINGSRHYGAYDVDTLREAVMVAFDQVQGDRQDRRQSNPRSTRERR